MRRVSTLSAVVVVVLFARVLAQAPIPAALRDAKTAYLVNEAGDVGRFDRIARELREWGRFTLVERMTEADIVIVLTHQSAGMVGTVNPYGGVVMGRAMRLALVVRDRATAEPLWHDTTPRVGGAPRLVERLRETLEPKKR